MYKVSPAATALPQKSRSSVSESEQHSSLHFPRHPGPTWTPTLSTLKAKRTGSSHPASDLPLFPSSRAVLDYSELGSAPHRGSWRLVATTVTLLGAYSKV